MDPAGRLRERGIQVTAQRLAVLRAVGGNRAQAAAKLGIGPATLYRKLKEFGAPAPA